MAAKDRDAGIMEYDVVRQAVNLARLVGATDREVRFIAEKIYLERHPGTPRNELPSLLEPILGCGAVAEQRELA